MQSFSCSLLILTVHVTTIDVQWEGMGGCRVGEVRAGTTSPMPDHKGFKLQSLVNFQKFSTLRVNTPFISAIRFCLRLRSDGSGII